MDTAHDLPADLLERGAACGRLLIEQGATVSVAEGSAGGLISAALLSMPGASAHYLGGTVIYTRKALDAYVSDLVDRPAGLRGASEPWVRLLATSARLQLDTTWGIGEGGAAGPNGNPYGDPSGHAWVAVDGPTPATLNITTGSDDRATNMVAFATAALDLLARQLQATG